jgi:pyruvate-formate lyase-activating enzyme
VPDHQSVEPAIDPNNRISFLLDWELTMKCNLDCSYCETGIHGGHDNTIPHPPLSDCLRTVDFMLEYVDLYMKNRPRGLKHVILNVYGGESLHHPQIIDILQGVRAKYLSNHYAQRWQLTVTTTTNAILSPKKLQAVAPYIDEFTVSYHVENTPKQKQQFRDNLLRLKQAGKRLKCVVLMHQEPDNFRDCEDMISWLEKNQIRVLPRQLDGSVGTTEGQRIYRKEQVIWFDKLYQSRRYSDISGDILPKQDANLHQLGRACCGGRQLCQDQNSKARQFFVDNQFPDWYCSVNYFFLYVKQVNGEIYVNKDCKMDFDGSVGPIGNLAQADAILDTLRHQIEHRSIPVIQCKKIRCFCGLCAPKAREKAVFDQIMEKFQL